MLSQTKRHAVLADAYREDAQAAADLWAGMLGGDVPVGTFGAAAGDTAPAEHAALLAGNEVAAVYAFQCLWTQRRMRGTDAQKRDAARRGWESFRARAEATEDVARGFGWDESAAWTTLQDVEVAGDTSEVTRVAKLAGRMHSALRAAAAAKVDRMPGEVHGIEQGRDVSRMLVSELSQFMDDDYELPMMARIVEGRALQVAVRGTGKQSRGPLVMALDESSSMTRRRRQWSKAAAIALARVAFDEKRHVAVVHYSTSIVVRQLKPGDNAELVQMIRHFLSGGTRIGLALDAALDTVADLAKKGQKGADVVLVTDGIDDEEGEQRAAVARAAREGVRLWTVAIDTHIAPESPLRTGAAEYLHIGDGDLNGTTAAVALGRAAGG